MAISKEILSECIIEQREMVDGAKIVQRPYEFEEKANYVFVGVRHVGKSYLLYQRIRQLIQNGHGWDEILFCNFDDERLAEVTSDDLNTLLEWHYSHSDKKPYIFLDEIQRIEHWELFARRLANEKYLVYITGSNAKMLSSEIATTLGGRYIIQEVYPYSFSEYLNACNVHLSADWQFSTRKRAEVYRFFNDYFYYGGLPEMVDYKQKRPMLSSLYQKIYLGDICARYRINDARPLSILVKKMAESVCQPVSYRRLHNIVVSTGSEISLPKVIDYVSHIEESWLAVHLENELARLADKESVRKYYFIDTGLLNLFLLHGEPMLLENLVAIELCRRYGRDSVSYYNAGAEIDFVVEEAKLAIQVCYRLANDDTQTREFAPLIKFAEKHTDWQLLVVTFDETNMYTFSACKVQAVAIPQWLLDRN
ncbi:MAG: ATP-binding protein [Paludibacteraceae bacterium]